MNKKFSTLMALALLAGSLPVAAENTTKWIPVTPDQLVNGAEYVIYNGSGDSIMFNGKVSKNLYSSSSEDGPVFLKSTQTSDKDSVWTLALTGKQFTLTPTTKDGKTENVNSVYGYNNILFTNTSSTPTSFSLSSEGLLTVGKNYVYAAGPRGAYGFKIDGTQEQASKFSFFMKKEVLTTDSIPNNMEEKDVVEGAVYVVDGDGKYIGIKSSLLRAAGGSLVATYAKDFIALTPEEKKAYVWIPEAKALKSAYASTPIYLNVNAKGVYISSTTSVDVTIENGVLSTASGNAEARFVTSEIQKPFEGDFYNAGFDEKNGKYFIKDANGIVLYAGNNSHVVNAKGELVGYNSNDAVETVWALTPHETSTKGVYELRLTDKEGNFLTVEGEFVTVDRSFLDWSASDAQGQVYNVYSFKNDDATVLLRAGGKYVGVVGGQLQVVDIYQATEFGLGNIQTAYVNAGTLLKRYNEYFTLKIDYDKDVDNVYETILTDIFEGKLVPKGSVSYTSGTATFTDAYATDTRFYLINEKKEVLVASKADEDVWSSGTTIHAYGLKLVSAHDFALDQQKPIAERNYMGLFSFEYTPGTEADEVTEITNIYVWEATSANSYTLHNIGCYMDKQTPVLAARGNATINKVRITLNPMALVDPTAWLTAPVYYNVEISNTNKKSAYFGKVLGLSENGGVTFVEAENVDLTKPEGQFAITYTGTDYIFTNRETKTSWSVPTSNLYTTEKENEFAWLGDTLLITPVKDYKPYDGFKRFTAAELNANTYTVSMKLLNGDSLNIIENHNDKHRLGLDEENATDWRIAMSTIRVNDGVGDLVAYVPDTVTVDVPITYYVGGKWKTTTTDYNIAKYNANQYVYNPDATLKICAYLLQNTDNNEYLYGINENESWGNAYYVCDENKESSTLATRIAFKLDGEGTVNLLPVYYDNVYNNKYNWNKDNSIVEADYDNYAEGLYLAEAKIIGGASSLTGVLKDENRFKATTNDLFVINVAEAPTYKKLDQGSKIIVSRVENNDEVIYEAGEFAGISNRAAYEDIKPTLYVDTAYVNRVGNFAYQYLLGVRINRVDTTYECNVPSHGIHRADTTFGYFLVNMIDSAKACTDVHKNKFVYNDGYKLAFVEGYRTNDTLYFTQNDKVVSKMEVGNGDYNIAKFAFKMIDEEANEFVIETGNGYNRQYTWNNGWEENVSKEEVEPGYLRWVNGNLVVTTDIEKAEHFTMEASDKEATANEAISAGNVVVAGVNGAVVVKGAEGKNVIVSTILGKVVANEVVSSDNATIAAPAGIVVVSVDGESFKVVVK